MIGECLPHRYFSLHLCLCVWEKGSLCPKSQAYKTSAECLQFINTSLMSLSGESKWSALISSQIPLTSANVCVCAHDIFMDDRWSPQHHWMLKRERKCEPHIHAHRALIHFQCFYQCVSAVSGAKLYCRTENKFTNDKLY